MSFGNMSQIQPDSTISEQTKTRNTTIDIAKGLGIILIVLGHNWLVWGGPNLELYRIIFSFHIPLFLFLSGVFIQTSGSIKKYVLSRADALLKPYLVIFLIVAISIAIFPGTKPTTPQPLILFLRALYATPGYLIWDWLPLWYLPHLFFALVVSAGILRSTSKTRKNKIVISLIAMSSLILGIWMLKSKALESPRPPFTLDVLPISISFILAGFLLKHKVQKMIFTPSIFIIAALAFSFLHYFFDKTLNLSIRVFDSSLISTAQAILGIYISLSISKKLRGYHLLSRVFSHLGKGSLFILLFHNLIQTRTAWGLLLLGFNNQASYAIGFFLGLTLPLVIWEIVKRNVCLSILLLPKQIGHYKIGKLSK